MSGVEVLSVISAVMAVITFAAQTATVCKDIYDGEADTDVHSRASSMMDATATLQAHCRTLIPLTPDEESLAAIARKCQVAATDLQKEVRAIETAQAKGNFIKSMRGALRSYTSKSKIEKLEKTLRGYETTMQTHLVVRLCTRTDAMELQQSQRFSQLGEEVQYFITQYATGHTQMSDLVRSEHRESRAHTTKEVQHATISVKDHITSELQQTGVRAATEGQRERLLRSLKHPTMNQRRNHVAESQDATFRWVLRSRSDSSYDSDSSTSRSSGAVTGHKSPEWPNFVEWLESEDEMYWISGKPGCGKSTLVKFLIESPETQAALDKWRPRTTILAHFLWKVGDSMQKNIRGFWCSLAHQRLSSDPAIVDYVLGSFEATQTKDHPDDWSLALLRKICLAALGRHSSPLCIFIDGLDEVADSDGAHGILQSINDIVDSLRPSVKVCVASRPEPRFRNMLKGIPELQLHSLTKRDMRKLADAKFAEFGPPSTTGYNNFQNMAVHELVSKADGVFIWLVLALRSVARGLENGDSRPEILERIKQLPEGIEQLYKDMWDRLNESKPIYQKAAAQYFSLAMANVFLRTTFPFWISQSVPPLFLAWVTVATSAKVSNRSKQVAPDLDTSGFTEECMSTKFQIENRCAGLLEVLGSSENSQVTFFHRTAFDYLTTTEDGQRILSNHDESLGDVHFRLAESLVRLASKCPHRFPIHLESVFFPLDQAMSYGRTAQVDCVLQLCAKTYEERTLPSQEVRNRYDRFVSGKNEPRNEGPFPKSVRSDYLDELLFPSFFSLGLHHENFDSWIFKTMAEEGNSQDLITKTLHGLVWTMGPFLAMTDTRQNGRRTVQGYLPAINRLLALGADPTAAGRYLEFRKPQDSTRSIVPFGSAIDLMSQICCQSTLSETTKWFDERIDIILSLLQSGNNLSRQIIVIIDPGDPHWGTCWYGHSWALDYKPILKGTSDFDKSNTLANVLRISLVVKVNLVCLLSLVLRPRAVTPETLARLDQLLGETTQAPSRQLLCVVARLREEEANGSRIQGTAVYRCVDPSLASHMVDASRFLLLNSREGLQSELTTIKLRINQLLLKALEDGVLEQFEDSAYFLLAEEGLGYQVLDEQKIDASPER